MNAIKGAVLSAGEKRGRSPMGEEERSDIPRKKESAKKKVNLPGEEKKSGYRKKK